MLFAEARRDPFASSAKGLIDDEEVDFIIEGRVEDEEDDVVPVAVVGGSAPRADVSVVATTGAGAGLCILRIGLLMTSTMSPDEEAGAMTAGDGAGAAIAGVVVGVGLCVLDNCREELWLDEPFRYSDCCDCGAGLD